jgi:protein-disulfide isomerase
MFNTITTSVVPAVRAHAKLAPRVQFLFRQQVQPWHPSSTLVHEAGVAILRLAPDRFWDFSKALFAAQKDYFDVSVVREVRNDTYRRLARLGAQSAGVEEAAMYDLLKVPEQPASDGSLNVGNRVTDDLKVLVKMARLVGVHVSPTVIFDGVVANDVSSSWTGEQWLGWLEKNVA